MAPLIPMATYCMAMSLTPGPNNMMLATSGANFGYRCTLPQILGINVGGFGLVIVASLGLGEIFVAWPAAQQVLRLLGAAYLVMLAWRLFRSRLEDSKLLQPQSLLQGALFQFINPKSWTKALTLASVFMPREVSPFVAGIEMGAIGTVVGFPCLSAWALFGTSIRGHLRDPFKRRCFNLAMAATLVVLAIDFLR